MSFFLVHDHLSEIDRQQKDENKEKSENRVYAANVGHQTTNTKPTNVPNTGFDTDDQCFCVFLLFL